MRWIGIVVVLWLLAGCADAPPSAAQPSPFGDMSGCEWEYWDMESRGHPEDCTPEAPDRADALTASERGMATCVVQTDTRDRPWDDGHLDLKWDVWWRPHPGVDGAAGPAYQVGLGYDLREHTGPVVGAFQLEHDGQESMFTWRADNGTGFLWLPTPILAPEILWQAMMIDPAPVARPNHSLGVEPVFHWLEPASWGGGPRWVPALQAFVDGERIQAPVHTNPIHGFGDPRQNAGGVHAGTRFYEWAYAEGTHGGHRIDADVSILLHMHGHVANTPQSVLGSSCCPALLADVAETVRCRLPI